MDLVCALPSAPHTLLEHRDHRPFLAFSTGLAVIQDGALDVVVQGAIDSAARGPDGHYYCTRADQILRCDLERGGEPLDLSAAFAGRPQGKRQIVCTPDGDIWVEGCTTRRHLNGTFLATPPAPATAAPAPCTADIYGNLWALSDGELGRQVLVLPANAPQQWQAAWLQAGQWDYLLADSVGFVWVAGPGGWRRFCPRRMEAGWQTLDDNLLPGAVTAVGFSPDDRILAAFDSGELVELDTNAGGELLPRSLATLPGAGRCVYTAQDGAIWAATDDGLYRKEAEADAWQRTWEKKRGRLPGGGNHDIFAAPCRDKLYVAGGWAGEWGLPPRDHVCDELFAYHPPSEYWQVISRMYIPRRYNGTAALDGRVWVVGGENRIVERGGEGQVLYTVDIYDPASNTWTAGPSLNVARTDPFVVICNGRIYAVGGAAHNSGPALDSVESIGPGDSAWRFETPLPQPARQGHACVLDGVIYCASSDGIFAFDTAANSWDLNLPQPGTIGQGPLAAAYGGEVWLIGGYEDQRIRCYDPGTRTWRPGPNLPTEQAWGAAVVLDGQLFIVGGAHYSKTLETVVFDDRTYVLRHGVGGKS